MAKFQTGKTPQVEHNQKLGSSTDTTVTAEFFSRSTQLLERLKDLQPEQLRNGSSRSQSEDQCPWQLTPIKLFQKDSSGQFVNYAGDTILPSDIVRYYVATDRAEDQKYGTDENGKYVLRCFVPIHYQLRESAKVTVRYIHITSAIEPLERQVFPPIDRKGGTSAVDAKEVLRQEGIWDISLPDYSKTDWGNHEVVREVGLGGAPKRFAKA